MSTHSALFPTSFVSTISKLSMNFHFCHLSQKYQFVADSCKRKKKLNHAGKKGFISSVTQAEVSSGHIQRCSDDRRKPYQTSDRLQLLLGFEEQFREVHCLGKALHLHRLTKYSHKNSSYHFILRLATLCKVHKGSKEQEAKKLKT